MKKCTDIESKTPGFAKQLEKNLAELVTIKAEKKRAHELQLAEKAAEKAKMEKQMRGKDARAVAREHIRMQSTLCPPPPVMSSMSSTSLSFCSRPGSGMFCQSNVMSSGNVGPRGGVYSEVLSKNGNVYKKYHSAM